MQTSPSVPSNPLTIVLTGTSRGLGKNLAQQLLKGKSNCKFIFTMRSQKDIEQMTFQWTKTYPQTNFKIKSLELSDKWSIEKFVQEIKDQGLMVDILVNNAALGADKGEILPDAEWAKKLLYTNVVGTILLTNSLIPLLNSNARIINVSSKLGALKFQTIPVFTEFSDSTLQQQQIYTAVEEYIALCQQGDLGKWFKSVYGTSKMLINAYSRFILKRKLKQNQVSIAMSPGHCQTDMGGKGAAHTCQQGAKSIYHCIFMQNPSFDIFYHRGNPHDFINCGPQVNSALLQKK